MNGALPAFIARRLMLAIPLLFVIILVNFLLVHAAPGDPVDFLLGSSDATPEYIAQVRHQYGLDASLPTQLFRYVQSVLQLDLGFSTRYQDSVLDLILARLPATLLLMGSALVLSSLGGILLGAIAARRPHSLQDYGAILIAMAGYSMPVFWLGQIMLIVFALQLAWFPTQGMTSLRAPTEGWGRILDIAQHLVLPVITYSAYHTALVFRLTRVKMQETLGQDFIMTARAKGVPEWRVVSHHALSNALLPVITVIGLNFGFMLAGSVLTETVFAWPGMGRLMFDAIAARDYPLLMGLFLALSVMVILANIITDVIYAMIDPRIVYR
jgi:ABC-type dipeptide/oligopeptide/nickel transport system permease component